MCKDHAINNFNLLLLKSSNSGLCMGIHSQSRLQAFAHKYYTRVEMGGSESTDFSTLLYRTIILVKSFIDFINFFHLILRLKWFAIVFSAKIQFEIASKF
jgi:hypothetical protein